METFNQGPSERPAQFPVLAAKLAVPNPIVLEVGSWGGASLVNWERAFGGRARFVLVDTWAPYFPPNSGEHYDNMTRLAASGEVLRCLWEQIDKHGMRDRVEVIQEDSRTALPRLVEKGRQFDFIYIDGNHAFEFALSDIRWGKLLTRAGGILCGDDLELQLHEVKDKARHEALLLDCFDYSHNEGPVGYHPGVTQAVGEEFGRVSSFSGIWAMRKTDSEWGPIL
jgi:hypothetical protein